MTLCRFCRSEDGPNEATTYINGTPVCFDCKTAYLEQAYNDWLAEQDDDRDMRDSSLDIPRLIQEGKL